MRARGYSIPLSAAPAPTFVFRTAVAVAGLALWLPQFSNPAAARVGLALAVAISRFHTVPWIGVNASSNRSPRRFTMLPLELARMESTVRLPPPEVGLFLAWIPLRRSGLRTNGNIFPTNGMVSDACYRI